MITKRKILIIGFIVILFNLCITSVIYADESKELANTPTQLELDAMAPSEQELKSVKEKVDAKPIYEHKASGETQSSTLATTATGTYPTFKGTILVTADKFSGIIPTGHAAIIFRYDTVVESLAQGVTWGPNDWNYSKQTAYGAEVKGVTSMEAQLAANWCLNQEGKPYNYNFFDTMTRDRFYCSQLVWAAFYDLYNVDISTSDFGTAIYPMEILNSPNVQVIYRKS